MFTGFRHPREDIGAMSKSALNRFMIEIEEQMAHPI
jgi:hypothetical protein